MKNREQTQSPASSSPRVATPSISFGKSAILRKELERVFPNSFFNESGHIFSEAELVEFLKDADAAIIGTLWLGTGENL